MKAKKGKFKVDFLKGEYEGYYFEGSSCPYLTYSERHRLMNDIKAYAPEMVDTEDGDFLLFPVGFNQFKWRLVK